jgi:UDP-glucose 4-epimerase
LIGGSGFVGSVVAKRLDAEGHDLTLCDDVFVGNAWTVPSGSRFVPADLSEPASLARVMAAGYDAVLHLSEAPPVEFLLDPVAYLRSNLGRVLNLLEAMAAHDVRRLVYASTAAVYGGAVPEPVVESTPPAPTSPYGTWNAAVEQAIALQAQSGAVRAVVLRQFCVAGASGDIGEWHHPETHLIPLALQAAAGLRPEVQVNGVNLPTPDGTAVRDYVHVEDVASAHLKALAATGTSGYAAYNLGTGVGTSVAQVIDIVRSLTGRAISTSPGAPRPGGPAVLVASTEKARAGLGWLPRRSVVDAIADEWAWMQARLSRTAVRA